MILCSIGLKKNAARYRHREIYLFDCVNKAGTELKAKLAACQFRRIVCEFGPVRSVK